MRPPAARQGARRSAGPALRPGANAPVRPPLGRPGKEAPRLGPDALLRRAAALGHRAEAVQPMPSQGPPRVQRRVGFEFETGVAVRNYETGNAPPAKKPFYAGDQWHIEPDAGNMEFVTDPLSTDDEVDDTLEEITKWVRELQSLEAELPGEQLDTLHSIDLQQEKEVLRGEEQEKKRLSIDEKKLVEFAAKKFEVEEEVVRSWIATHGLLAVENVVTDSKVTKDVLGYLNSLLAMTASSLRIKSPGSFDVRKREIVEGFQFRRLDQMSSKGNLQFPKLSAVGTVEPMTAAPQTTIGLPLDQIISAMHLIPTKKVYTGLNTDHEQTHTLTGMNQNDGALMVESRRGARNVVATCRETLDGVEEGKWRELEGLIALAASYIRKGHQPRALPFKDSKEIAPLMSRVDFGTLFESLDAQLQDFFTAQNVAQAAGVDADANVFGEKGFGKGEKGPTVRMWVFSIAMGNDLLSAGSMSSVTDPKKGGSPSMGEFTELDNGLAPLELRRLPKGVEVGDWASLAQQIFTFAEVLRTSKLY